MLITLLVTLTSLFNRLLIWRQYCASLAHLMSDRSSNTVNWKHDWQNELM